MQPITKEWLDEAESMLRKVPPRQPGKRAHGVDAGFCLNLGMWSSKNLGALIACARAVLEWREETNDRRKTQFTYEQVLGVNKALDACLRGIGPGGEK
jgi:hypothetical protein